MLTLRFLRRPGGAITLQLGEGALVQSFAMTERILENLFTEYYDCTGYADSRFIVSGSQQTNTIGITHRHDRWLVPWGVVKDIDVCAPIHPRKTRKSNVKKLFNFVKVLTEN